MPESSVPKVFVHGNPETDAVWEPLVAALAGRGVTNVRLLSPPGFGAPLPAGFGSTRDEYRDWLIGELEALGEPVDLVGHDWGAGHVYALLAERQELARSWAADCAGLLHPEYEWHDAAQMWQRPGDGEAIAELMRGLPPEAVIGWGVSPDYAPSLAAGIDEPMTTAMLALYRSALQPAMRELGVALTDPARPPGLVIEPDGDPYVPAALSHAMAGTLGADVLALPGCGHWWMWQAPDRAADALVAFWNSL